MKDPIRSHTGLVVLLLAAAAIPAVAQQFALAVDVPSSLGGTLFGANQIVLYTQGTYSLGTDLSSALGPAGHITALTEASPGVYYLAVDVPTTISGTTYRPNDIVQATGGTFSLVRSGSALGIPAGVGIGAMTRVPSSGLPVIALTAPATIGSTSYMPTDLILVNGTSLSLYWSGGSYGVPSSARLAGAEVMLDNTLLVQFDIPVTLAGTTFLPGQIAKFSGSFSSTPWFADGTFPAGSAMTDFALTGGAGAVPDGSASSTPLKVSKSTTPGALDFTWGATCTSEVTGYGVYQGSVGSWYSHKALACLGSTATAATLTPGAGNTYFLVVPNNGDYEGGYGKNSAGSAIPPSGSPCKTVSDSSPCP